MTDDPSQKKDEVARFFSTGSKGRWFKSSLSRSQTSFALRRQTRLTPWRQRVDGAGCAKAASGQRLR